MKQTKPHRAPSHRAPVGRIAGAILLVGGLSASAVTAGTAGAAGAAGAATSTTVSTSKNAKLGTILVSGTTVYTLKASKTSCGAGCLKIWPEVLLPEGVDKAQAGPGVAAAKLGTVKRGGALQVTYGGKPLYWFSGDQSAGQVKGNVTDKWGKWSVVVTAKPTPSSSGTGSSGSNAGTGGVSF